MSTVLKPLVIAYTDGSCYPNPGPGGWGVHLEFGPHSKDLKGGVESTTNNRMELRAVIEAIKAIKEWARVEVVTDSQYVLQGITVWIIKWKSNNWMRGKKSNKLVKNVDLWKELDELVQKKDVMFRWVKGHNGDPLNEFVDALAVAGRMELQDE